MPKNTKKVVLGMSGGIDSSVAALGLLKSGFEVIGVSFLLLNKEHWDKKAYLEAEFSLKKANLIAQNIGIKHYIFDYSANFKSKITDYFEMEYLSGRTPSPCVRCNRTVKLKYLKEIADMLNIKYISTGHYANVGTLSGKKIIRKAKDKIKDQSYFLWQVETDTLDRIIFPLGEITKHEVKDIARKNSLIKTKKYRDSYGLCFVKGNYNETKIFRNSKKGNIIDEKGNNIGRHNGIPLYTIGQKIKIGANTYYVKKINKSTNTITVCSRKNDLLTKKISITDTRLIVLPQSEIYVRLGNEYLKAKISSDLKSLIFEKEILAPAAGQSIAFYYKDYLIGGAIINFIFE